ncbi:hypothetical protein DICPUDRAFT_86210 [Dictyostelium purpureum]|uniref:Reverse transcriptase domain-containing protein n=1 Tax=Dictyostelium purpureum TaxID=5786 RepID=F0ZA83_DICPU|nr:uncharacterized protein DICPUDRAFT_86210 [Dictyostelium purpureum]EGC39187.1 hypothetical protein DICPUDRAFT_86210 [Dictyostelium purpureum]|eukprot:XP_003284333.1 hypothetical protein DICPUDRAFT_86210 [Dictyostelium purpureum]
MLIKNRRPITLANCLYKIQSKVINNRLQTILPDIINPNQKGFTGGRKITDNTMTVNEIIKYCIKNKLPGIITFYDFEKAFDSISHDAIYRTLLHIQVPTKLTNLIMQLLTNSFAKIEINGKNTDKFIIGRGVKQGDPLSPTLYVMVIEALARSILEDKSIIGLPLDNTNRRIKFQGFADDSSSMVHNNDQLNLVLQHFNQFCTATSSKLNIDKSVSITINNPDTTNSVIPISNKPERYLGYYFTGTGIHRKLPEILNSIRSSLSLWKTTSNSIKTKVNILKSFALSRITYYSYIEEFNDDEIKEINKIADWFLSAPNNKSPNGFKVFKLMSSKRANYPMDQGGWNLWNIKNRQKAQRLWMINQIINKIETNKIESEYQHSWKHQISTKTITSDYLFKNYNDWIQIKVKKGLLDGLKSIKNKDGKPLSLAEWYSEINNLNSFTPKTEFQQCLQLTGYSYINLFNNILNIKDPKSRNTLFKFQARCLPINFIHNKPCRLCNENLNNDPYGHLFFKCKKTLKFINFNKLKSFIFITSGRGLNWSLDITRSRRNISIKNITYKIPEGRKSDGEINMDYNNTRFHKSHFQWNYKAIDFDLTRCFAYRNAIALITRNAWMAQ